ncbi:MAG: restriction endonuclease [Chloroflexota bacterium]
MTGQLPKYMYEVSFGYSRSPRYAKALNLCKKFENYHLGKDSSGNIRHTILASSSELNELKLLFNLVKRWTTTSLKIQGKPSRSLSFKNTKWREFEELVARIEKTLIHQQSDIDIKLTSPDKEVIDKVTHEKREVDATIRYKLGSSEHLIAIECRDRHRIQDVTWIEQLATKANDIGATQTIAVSSSQFSKSAMRKAAAHGIELRLMHEITDTTLQEWNTKILIYKVYPTSFEILNCTLGFEGEGELTQETNPLLRTHPFSTKVIFHQDNDEGYTLEEFIYSLSDKLLESVDKKELKDGKHKIGLSIKVSSLQKLYVLTTLGPSRLVALSAQIRFHYKTESVPLQNVFQYSENKAPITQIAKGSITLNGEDYSIYVQPSE